MSEEAMTQGGKSQGWEGGLPPPIQRHSSWAGAGPLPDPELIRLEWLLWVFAILL